MPAQPRFPARAAHARILDPQKDRTKYHLVYLTTHPLGLIEFMEASEKLDLIQKQVRADTKQRARDEKTRIHDMFGASDQTAGHEDHVDISEVEKYWLQALRPDPKLFGEKEFADMLEETDWFPGDLQRALGNLMKRGVVENLDTRGIRRSKFLHFEKNGERLQLIRESQ